MGNFDYVQGLKKIIANHSVHADESLTTFRWFPFYKINNNLSPGGTKVQLCI